MQKCLCKLLFVLKNELLVGDAVVIWAKWFIILYLICTCTILPDNPVLRCVNVLSKNRIAAIQKMMTWWHFAYVTFYILDMHIYTYVYVYIYNMYICIYIYIECVYIHIDIPDTYTLLCKIQAFNRYIQ